MSKSSPRETETVRMKNPMFNGCYDADGRYVELELLISYVELELLISYVMRPADPTGYLLKKEGSK